jgi:hypothetical protein
MNYSKLRIMQAKCGEKDSGIKRPEHKISHYRAFSETNISTTPYTITVECSGTFIGITDLFLCSVAGHTKTPELWSKIQPVKSFKDHCY